MQLFLNDQGWHWLLNDQGWQWHHIVPCILLNVVHFNTFNINYVWIFFIGCWSHLRGNVLCSFYHRTIFQTLLYIKWHLGSIYVCVTLPFPETVNVVHFNAFSVIYLDYHLFELTAFYYRTVSLKCVLFVCTNL